MECGRPDSKATRSACPAQQVRLPDHVGQRARTQALGQGHVRPMGRIGREEIVAHWQQMGNKARVSRQHYTTAGYRPPPNESPCPGTPNLQRDRASPSRRPSSCGIHCFPGTDGGPWRAPHLLKSRNQPFDFNGRFCQASGSLKRLRCAGVSTFGSSKAAANAARSPRYQPSSSWQTRRTIVSGRPPWAHNAYSCVSRLRNRRRRCPAGRQNGPRNAPGSQLSRNAPIQVALAFMRYA